MNTGKRTLGLGAALALGAACGSALAGGGPENVLIIINPASAESMYLGHYYQFARNIPASNVLYIDPAALNYPTLAGPNGNIDAMLGKLSNTKLGSIIDYVVVASGQSFYVAAPGLMLDSCFPATRMSQTSVFTTAYIRNQLLAGGVSTQETNHYFGAAPVAFDSNITWLNGVPSSSGAARRYVIAAQLGYTGALGNSVADITAMIDRAVAADGTHPAGKFYFMNTSDPIRTPPRSPGFAPAVAAIQAAGGQAEIINDVLPDLRNDCLGIMTGWPDPIVDTATYTLLPGAFCDHLTSWAATFDNGQQTKMSAWIRRGAAGSSGAVEEPCNYPGKFPVPNMHVVYFKGLSLGEAWFRSMQYAPFQLLFQGDPITRPFATIPVVNGNVPSGDLSGFVAFTPTASTALPGASIQSIELLIDGVPQVTKAPGSSFVINTGCLAEGAHEARVLAYDNTPVKTVGRWVGTFNVVSYGRSVSMNFQPLTGTMTTAFTGNVSVAGGGVVSEVRLVQNGRVLAVAPSAPAALNVFGRNIGPGKTRVQAEVLYTDGLRSLSPFVNVDIAFTAGTPSGQPPVAHSYRKRIMRNTSCVVELPATFDDSLANSTFTLLSNPSQATVGTGDKGYRVFTAPPNACGPDTFTFRVNTPSGQSNTATVTLIYDAGPACPADTDGVGGLTANDFMVFMGLYNSGSLRADMNGDCNLNAVDFFEFINAYATGCPAS